MHPNSILSWKEQSAFKDRIQHSSRILFHNPERRPILVFRAPDETLLPALEKYKYLVPVDITVGQFIWSLKKDYLNVDPQTAIYWTVGDGLHAVVPNHSETILALYRRCKDLDGFLYVNYKSESVFGSNFTG
jgi:GABA(A) receptor-associated protein